MKKLIILLSLVGMLWAVVPEAQAGHHRHYRRVVYGNHYNHYNRVVYRDVHYRRYDPYCYGYGYRPVRYFNYGHSDYYYPRYYSSRCYSSPRFAISIGF